MLGQDSGKDEDREPQPKVEVIIGPGTVVFIAAVLQAENVDDSEMLPVRYDARFQKIRIACPKGEESDEGCRETRLDAIGFPKTYEPKEAACDEPMVIGGVRFDGRVLDSRDAPRGSRKKRSTAWFQAGLSVENGATILANYRCPADAQQAKVEPQVP